MLDCATVLNPVFSTLTVYVAGDSRAARNVPSDADTTLRVSPVDEFLTVTEAPETVAPLLSTTVPVMAPVPAVCAAMRKGTKHNRSRHASIDARFIIVLL